MIKLLVNLNREHIRHFNKAISVIYDEQRRNTIKGKISDILVSENKGRLEYLRETLHLIGNISINENEYNLIKKYIN